MLCRLCVCVCVCVHPFCMYACIQMHSTHTCMQFTARFTLKRTTIYLRQRHVRATQTQCYHAPPHAYTMRGLWYARVYLVQQMPKLSHTAILFLCFVNQSMGIQLQRGNRFPQCVCNLSQLAPGNSAYCHPQKQRDLLHTHIRTTKQIPLMTTLRMPVTNTNP